MKELKIVAIILAGCILAGSLIAVGINTTTKKQEYILDTFGHKMKKPPAQNYEIIVFSPEGQVTAYLFSPDSPKVSNGVTTFTDTSGINQVITGRVQITKRR